jgi:zinc/manganese transport system substrate-binding protein
LTDFDADTRLSLSNLRPRDKEPKVTTSPQTTRRPRSGRVAAAAALCAATLSLAACGGVTQGGPGSASGDPIAHGAVKAVGAENEYADVISQIGGPYVSVAAIESNPNTDPHTFEASASVANEIAGAALVVRNGLGYDTWARTLMAAAPDPERKVIDVQDLLGLPSSTPNPHLWYDPVAMPAVARAIATDLSELVPAHRSYFEAKLRAFDASLEPWLDALAAFKARYGGTPVAVTEPVGDDLLQAAGCDIRTPFSLQAAVMNGTDPSPEDVTIEDELFTHHEVKVLVYNQQVTDPLTASFETLARREGIPIVGVYETMPTPGYDYQSWMLAEVHALVRAVTEHVSTTRL